MTRRNEAPRVTKKSLFEAIAKGDTAKLRQLLETAGDPNTIDRSDGYTLLNLAVEREDNETVKVLLAAGADPRTGVIDNMDEAIRAGNPHLVKLLLDAGASEQELNRDGNDEAGRTPLMEAARRGQAEVVKVLVAAGADVNAHDHAGDSAIIHAAKAKRSTVIEFLRPLVDPQSGLALRH